MLNSYSVFQLWDHCWQSEEATSPCPKGSTPVHLALYKEAEAHIIGQQVCPGVWDIVWPELERAPICKTLWTVCTKQQLSKNKRSNWTRSIRLIVQITWGCRNGQHGTNKNCFDKSLPSIHPPQGDPSNMGSVGPNATNCRIACRAAPVRKGHNQDSYKFDS